MNKKTITSALVGVGTLIVGGVLLHNKGNSKTVEKVVTKVAEEPEELFDGIPLSELSELAKQCYHGIKCTIDKYGFLVFYSTSNSGKTKFHTQMALNEAGKLINLGGHYPGQWKSSADTFAELFNKKYKN